MRKIAGLILLAAAIGYGWVFSLPDKKECAASGRVVDPTERHCESGDRFVQLEEHALFHSVQVVLGAAVLLVIAYGATRYARRRILKA